MICLVIIVGVHQADNLMITFKRIRQSKISNSILIIVSAILTSVAFHVGAARDYGGGGDVLYHVPH